MSSSSSSRANRGDVAVRAAALTANFLILQWLGLRLRRDEDPGRVWITARRSLSRAETITTEDVDLASARPVRRWTLDRWTWPMTGWWSPIRTIRRGRGSAIDSAVVLAIGVLLAFGALAAHAWSSSRRGTSDPGELTIALTRRPGIEALRSRCVDCAQPGDELTTRITTPRSGREDRVIRVYLDERPIASCADCSSLSFQVISTGRYVVVGAQAANRLCSFDQDQATLDGDLAGFAGCDARIATSKFQVR